MQINHNSSPNFGMAVRISPEVQKILAKKMTNEKKIARLESLVNEQTINPFKVDIRDELGTLKAYISDAKDKEDISLVVLKQNFVEKLFKNPLAFIERCCKKADSMNEEKYQTNINSRLKDIFEKTKA